MTGSIEPSPYTATSLFVFSGQVDASRNTDDASARAPLRNLPHHQRGGPLERLLLVDEDHHHASLMLSRIDEGIHDVLPVQGVTPEVD